MNEVTKSVITDEIFESYLTCKYKACLKLRNEHGMKTEYEVLKDNLDRRFHTIAETRLLANHAGKALSHIPIMKRLEIQNAVGLIINTSVVHAGLQATFDALIRSSRTRDILEPVMYCRLPRVPSSKKLCLAFKALVLGCIQDATPTHGHIIHGGKCDSLKVRLASHLTKAENILREMTSQIGAGANPLLILNSHCNICEFCRRCRDEAIEADSLSLLHGISEKEIHKQNQKGIFTVRQLSYTFRARKVPRHTRNPVRPHSFALQALSLRENTIHIHGVAPELPAGQQRVYFDIEAVPDRDLFYLIGSLVVEKTSDPRYRFFWADDETEQSHIFTDFVEYVSELSDCSLFHFGAFEKQVLRRMKCRLDERLHSVLDSILERSVNVLSILYAHVYFPTYSNSLKEIGAFLGCKWTGGDVSGMQSVVWRTMWEDSHDPILKAKLIQYNKEDCLALMRLLRFIERAKSGQDAYDHNKNVKWKVTHTDELRRVPPIGRPIFRQADFVLEGLAHVNKCAYFDYQRERVFVRTHKEFRAINKRRRLITSPTYKPNRQVEPYCKKCPHCKSTNITCTGRTRTEIVDLKFSANGVRRWITEFIVRQYQCLDCEKSFHSSRIPDRRHRYGPALQRWCVYMHVARRNLMGEVRRNLRDIFDISVDLSVLLRFKRSLAEYYHSTYDRILEGIVRGSILHIDETRAKIRSSSGYVWVLTSMNSVYYLFKDSREGKFLKELLADFKGVLVSDFYTAYDSLGCLHQKCLVHLIRDLNDDLMRNPFDAEFKEMTQEFAELLRAIVTTIDRFGLKRYYLQKHKRTVGRFLDSVCLQTYSSEVTRKYQERFQKNRDKLFTFLDYDGVPWNNNNAEHAIKPFARYRRLLGARLTKDSIQEYLVLLSVVQTCEYNNIDTLKFLLSMDRGLERILDSRRRSRYYK